jgi:hypothetical protein
MHLCQENLFSTTILSDFILGINAGFTNVYEDDDYQNTRISLVTSGTTKQCSFEGGALTLALDLDQHNLPYLAQLARLRDWCLTPTVTFKAALPTKTSVKEQILDQADPNCFRYSSVEKLNLVLDDQCVNDYRDLEKEAQMLAEEAVQSKVVRKPTVRILPSGPPVAVKVISPEEYAAKTARSQGADV